MLIKLQLIINNMTLISITGFCKQSTRLVPSIPQNKIIQIFPNVTIVIKSANTFITTENQVFICDEGRQNLAKGGSGDVLAGLIGSLLAQRYSAKESAITGVLAHANASKKFGGEAYDLTPEKLINEISNLKSIRIN